MNLSTLKGYGYLVSARHTHGAVRENLSRISDRPTDDTQPTDMPVQSINIPTAPDAEIPQPDVTDQPQDIDIIDDLPLMP